jgi:hypothetical protein
MHKLDKKVKERNCILIAQHEIWVSHGGEDVSVGLLGCHACGLLGRYQSFRGIQPHLEPTFCNTV